MTDSGATDASGWNNRPRGDDGTTAPLPPPVDAPPAAPPIDAPPAPPAFGAAPPASIPFESVLTSAADDDTGSLVPDQLHDAPVYVPPPVGMTPGGMLPPPNPADVPTSAWITTAAPIATGSSRRTALVSIVVAIVGIIVVGAVVLGILGPNNKGQVLFGTAAGKDLCSVSNPVTAVKATDPIFFAAVLRHKMDGAQAITFHITKDGQDFVSHDEPADGTAFDCYGNRESLGALEPGTYVFEVIHNKDIEASGTLKVQ